MSEISKYALDKLIKGGLYVGLSGGAGEPSTGGYQRKVINKVGEITWSNTGNSPWLVEKIDIYQNPSDSSPIASISADRGEDPAAIGKNDVFRVNLKL